MTIVIQLTPQVVEIALHAEKGLEEQESGTQTQLTQLTQTQLLVELLEEPMLIPLQWIQCLLEGIPPPILFQEPQLQVPLELSKEEFKVQLMALPLVLALLG